MGQMVGEIFLPTQFNSTEVAKQPLAILWKEEVQCGEVERSCDEGLRDGRQGTMWALVCLL